MRVKTFISIMEVLLREHSLDEEPTVSMDMITKDRKVETLPLDYDLDEVDEISLKFRVRELRTDAKELREYLNLLHALNLEVVRVDKDDNIFMIMLKKRR